MQNQVCLLIVSSLVTFSILIPNASFAHTIYPTPEEFYKNSDLIVMGKILSYDDNQSDIRYIIEVKEYVKKPANYEDSKGMEIFGCNPTAVMGGGCQTYDKGQEVFFGLDKKEDGKLHISGGNAVQNQNCTGKQLLETVDPSNNFRIIQNNKTTTKVFSGIETSLAYDFTSHDLHSENFTVKFHVRYSSDKPENETLSETKHVLVPECTKYTVISTPFIPKKTGTYEVCAEVETGAMMCYGGITTVDKIDSPLKQIKAGILPDKITCKEGLELVLKTEHRHQPMCVTPSTKAKMIQIGLAQVIRIAE